MQFIRKMLQDHKGFIIYLLISCFVTVVDVGLSFSLENLIGTFFANAIGVVTGFILQYILMSRKVFNRSDMRAFIVFILTFIAGLILAQAIVVGSRRWLFHGQDTILAFIVSKGLSIVIPFFFMYFTRKKLLSKPREDVRVG